MEERKATAAPPGGRFCNSCNAQGRKKERPGRTEAGWAAGQLQPTAGSTG